MPFSLIPFALIAIPIAEIAVFILIGGQIGVLWTLALILVTAVIGSILLRVQGFTIVNRLREETNAGRIPGRELGHGAMILVAGVLLLTPGFVTDTMGFLLFVPPIRDWIWSAVSSRIQFVGPGEGFRHRGYRGDDHVVDLDPEDYSRHEDDDGGGSRDRANPNSPWREGPRQ